MTAFGRPPEQRVFSVGDVVATRNRLLDGYMGSVWVEGEISNLKIPASGHAYFTLVGPGRQGSAAVDVVLWRSILAHVRVRLEDGRRVRVYGRPGIYEKAGRFQLYGQRVREAGVGDRLEALAALRRRLEADGLLDPARKRPLPFLPRRIGVVTSKTGAALRDVVAVTRARCPVPILVAHARVQGDGAAEELRRALERIVAEPDVDVVILGRGGGSMEDLWAFNDEALARAVAESPVPVISAVGHEVDVAATDWVADVRAATPSQAAELAVPDAAEIAARFDEIRDRLAAAVTRAAVDRDTRLRELRLRLAHRGERLGAEERRRLDGLATRLARCHPGRRLGRHRVALEDLRARLGRTMRARLHRARLGLQTAEVSLCRTGETLTAPARRRLSAAEAALSALDPRAVLARGYAIALDAEGRAVTDAGTLSTGDRLALLLARGRAAVTVEHAEPDGWAERSDRPRGP